MKKASFLFCTLLTIALIGSKPLKSQDLDSLKTDQEKTKAKKGWTFGALPAIAYNSDEGFRYGALTNLYYYGDGTTYPDYLHSIYLEWSRTTKGGGLNNFYYDSEYLIPGIRSTVDVMYLTEKALDFYGFNGREAIYNMDFEDPDSPDYISGAYYRLGRKLMRVTADFQGKLFHPKLKWVAGLGYFGLDMREVDLDVLNKGRDEDELLPDVPGLYEEYVSKGIIPSDIKNGGKTSFIKAGLVWDTRDNKPNPMHGQWTECFAILAPGFTNGDYGYSQLVMIHRHYFSLVPNVLSLANRIGFQGRLSGSIPYYMLPFTFNTLKTYDGFGGSKTVRGVIRNRIQGDGVAFGNVELRYKVLRTRIFNQNFYVALSGFLDGGSVVQKHPVDYATAGIAQQKDKLHLSAGGGLHLVLNDNFIVAIDYGRPLKKEDGTSGLYIGLNFLY